LLVSLLAGLEYNAKHAMKRGERKGFKSCQFGANDQLCDVLQSMQRGAISLNNPLRTLRFFASFAL
jgi:hypothetical protein